MLPSLYLHRHKLSHSPLSFFPDIDHLVSVSPTQSNSPADSLDDDLPSPRSSPSAPPLCTTAFHSSVSPPEMFHTNSSNSEFTTPPNPFSSAPDAHHGYNINSPSASKDSEAVPSYLSDSPSPVESQSASFPHQSAVPPPHCQYLPKSTAAYLSTDRSSPAPSSPPSRYPLTAAQDKYPHQNSYLDQRRMSEPAVLGSTNLYATQATDSASSRYQQFNLGFNSSSSTNPRSSPAYIPSLQRGVSIGSLRDLRHQPYGFHSTSQSQSSAWKDNSSHHHEREVYSPSLGLEEPISPLQPDFSGGLLNSSAPLMPYSPTADSFYGPSPPGTGTSTSSNPQLGASYNHAMSYSHSHALQRSLSHEGGRNDPNNSKTYSFVSLPGNTVKKRPRRRYDEIERLYQCSYPDCSKAYGTLNHLNAHVTMQKHGQKRNPNEFKELRKQWRKAKKESEALTGPIRRGSMSLHHDGHDMYDPNRYGSARHFLRRHHSSHTPMNLSSSIPQQSINDRFAVGVDDIHYSPHDREEHVGLSNMFARQRYNGTSMSASWNSDFSLSTRPNTHGSYMVSHHGQNPQPVEAQQEPTPPSSSHGLANRLPPDSTLFTPLPGYQQSSILPTLPTDIVYSTEGYDLYEEDSNGRPGTGHGSMGPSSADEYDHRN